MADTPRPGTGPLELPPEPTPLWLRCFWASLVAVLFAVAAGVTAWMDASLLPRVGLGAAALLFIGLLRPPWVAVPYRAWRRGARLYAEWASRAVLALWYGAGVRTTARLRGGAVGSRQEGRGWVVLDDGLPGGGRQAEDEACFRAGNGSLVEVAAWLARRGRPDLLGHLPFLAALRWVGRSSPAPPSPELYTLY